jgi:hypothetical protein
MQHIFKIVIGYKGHHWKGITICKMKSICIKTFILMDKNVFLNIAERLKHCIDQRDSS